jgi:voltage-gated potassium channel
MQSVGDHDHDDSRLRRPLPVTALGRLTAFGLTIGGIALVGTVTATLASWFVETVAAEKEQAEDLQATVRRLESKVDQVSREQEGPDAS